MNKRSVLPYLYSLLLIVGAIFGFAMTNPWRPIFKGSDGELTNFATFYADKNGDSAAKSQAIVYFVCTGVLLILGLVTAFLQIKWAYQSMLVTLLSALVSLLACALGIVMFRAASPLEYVSGITFGVLFVASLLFFPLARRSFEEWMNKKLSKK
jgi:hypothetical protein